MGKQKAKVLFFIAGTVPNDEEREAAKQYEANGGRICYRVARLVRNDESPEDFDIVAGAVPPVYAKAAADKPKPEPAEPPKADPAAIGAGGPLKAPEGAQDGGAGATAPAGEATAPAASTAAPAAPKPDPSKGWKPNA
jgi:hypothetical protein